MKGWLIRIVYMFLVLYGLYSLCAGHYSRRMNQILLGLGVLFLAMFLMHYPISYITDKGFY